MNKIALFIVAVFLGVVGFLILSNQDTAKPPVDINFQITPTGLPTLEPQASPPATTSSDVEGTQDTKAKTAVIKTSKGDITIELYTEDAPKTVANFLTKAGTNYYDNLTFHRVEDWVTQGGDPKGDGTGGGNMETELNQKPFIIGSVGVARGGDIKISNDSQFFITKKDSPHLNGQYTNFGMVTAGMDVVEQIAIGDKILGITVE